MESTTSATIPPLDSLPSLDSLGETVRRILQEPCTNGSSTSGSDITWLNILAPENSMKNAATDSIESLVLLIAETPSSLINSLTEQKVSSPDESINDGSMGAVQVNQRHSELKNNFMNPSSSINNLNSDLFRRCYISDRHCC